MIMIQHRLIGTRSTDHLHCSVALDDALIIMKSEYDILQLMTVISVTS